MITELLDGQLISLVSAIEKTTRITEVDCIGIVFPCYLAQLNGVPLIVEDFCKLLKHTTAKYVFALCTYGGFGPVNAYPTLNIGIAFRNPDTPVEPLLNFTAESTKETLC